MEKNYKEKIEKVNTFVFDVDGVFTDSSVMLLPDGTEARTMSTRDGYAVQYAVKRGYRVWVITGGSSKPVERRFNKLGVKEVFLGVHDKVAVLKELMQKHGVSKEEMLYMGDDIPDYHAMQLVGTKTCPNNSDNEILAICDYISHINGGHGCVRDVVEQTLRVQKQWLKKDDTASI